MESANKEEAKRCLQKAVVALKRGDIQYAKKLASKSYRLCPTEEAQDFIKRVCDVQNENECPVKEASVNEGSENSTQRPHQSGGPLGEEADQETYSKDQSDAVKRVLRCKDYYEVLDVARDATDSQLKKQYKRLALALHPDKNRAPQSDEAFKAISKAYSTLSDPTRRNHYDRFGEDGLRENVSSPADVSPDDLFRMFFGDGDRFFEDDGFVFTSRNLFTNHHRNYRRGRHFHYRRSRQDDGSLVHLCQILPIMLIVLMSILGSVLNSLFAPAPLYSLYQTSSYSERRETSKHSVPYYVKTGFKADTSKIEEEIIALHISDLKERCRYDRVWGEGSRSKACRRLKKFL